MQFLPLFLAMPRRCYVCGAPYLGGSVCSDRNCVRNGRRQRDIGMAQRVDDVEAPPPVSQSPRLRGEASAVAMADRYKLVRKLYVFVLIFEQNLHKAIIC